MAIFIEKIMVDGIFDSAEIVQRYNDLGIYEIKTYCTASHIYPHLGDKKIVISNIYIKVIDGSLYDCNDHFDFDGEPEDSVFSPLVCFPRKETAEVVGSFFNVDTTDVAIGVDESQLFKLKYEKGYVWDSKKEDFVPINKASNNDVAFAQKAHQNGWSTVALYNPSMCKAH